MQVYSGIPHDAIETSAVLRIQNLELTLEKALEDISLLQANLGYVIRVKEDLESELAVREKREQALVKEYEREVGRREREIQGLRGNQ